MTKAIVAQGRIILEKNESGDLVITEKSKFGSNQLYIVEVPKKYIQEFIDGIEYVNKQR